MALNGENDYLDWEMDHIQEFEEEEQAWVSNNRSRTNSAKSNTTTSRQQLKCAPFNHRAVSRTQNMSPVEAANENLKSEIILHASAYDIPLDDNIGGTLSFKQESGGEKFQAMEGDDSYYYDEDMTSGAKRGSGLGHYPDPTSQSDLIFRGNTSSGSNRNTCICYAIIVLISISIGIAFGYLISVALEVKVVTPEVATIPNTTTTIDLTSIARLDTRAITEIVAKNKTQ